MVCYLTVEFPDDKSPFFDLKFLLQQDTEIIPSFFHLLPATGSYTIQKYINTC